MTANQTYWLGVPFQILNKHGNWSDVGGVYIFARPDRVAQRWDPLYVGETESFASRLPYHDRWDEAAMAGATHVHAVAVGNAHDRHALEQRLIEALHPPLNKHHRMDPLLAALNMLKP